MYTQQNPTESEKQIALFEWAKWNYAKYPELKLMYHIPNEGKRSVSTGARLKREGLKKGVADICLPCPRGKHHGLYMELKSEDGKASKEQIDFLYAVCKEGYSAHICYGAENAINVLKWYLRQSKPQKTEESKCMEKAQP